MKGTIPEVFASQGMTLSVVEVRVLHRYASEKR
jgi:hypothetical protein